MAYISIEGNIGAGKSTFIKTFAELLSDVEWVTQPVDEWRNLGTESYNVLDHYYANPQRWGLTFQLFVIGTRIRKLNSAISTLSQEKKNIIMQRSTEADQRVFSKLMKQVGYINSMEYSIFQNLYPIKDERQHKIIYLKCSPQTCQKRIRDRSRQEESTIEIEYLKIIHELHNDWIYEITKETQQLDGSNLAKIASGKRKILIINAQDDYREAIKRSQISHKIRQFLNS